MPHQARDEGHVEAVVAVPEVLALRVILVFNIDGPANPPVFGNVGSDSAGDAVDLPGLASRRKLQDINGIISGLRHH